MSEDGGAYVVTEFIGTITLNGRTTPPRDAAGRAAAAISPT